MDGENDQILERAVAAAETAARAVAEQEADRVSQEPRTDESAREAAAVAEEARSFAQTAATDAVEARAKAERAAEEADSEKASVEDLRNLVADLRGLADRQAAQIDSLQTRLGKLEHDGGARVLVESSSSVESGGGSGRSFDDSYRNVENAGFENPHAYEVIVSGAGDGGGSGNKVCCYVPKYSGLLLAGPFCGPHIGNDQSISAPESAGPYAGGAVWAGSNPPTGADCSWSHFGWREIGTIPEGTEVQQRVVYAKFEIPCEPQGPTETEDEQKVRGPKLVEIGMKENADWINLVKDSWKARDPSCGVRQRLVPIALVANSIVTQLTMTPYFDCVPKCCVSQPDDSSESPSPESPSQSESSQPTSCFCPTGTIAEFGGMRIYNKVLQYATVQKEFKVNEETGCCELVTGKKVWEDLINFKDCEE